MVFQRLSVSAIAIVFALTVHAADPTPESIFEHLRTPTGRDAGSLQSWMEKRHVPGVSIAVIRNFEVAWTYTVGARNVESKAPVNDNTLFQAASISKPVSGAAVHRLAEQGKLDLDAPIANYLSSWKIPPYDFPGTPSITARMLMSHRAGTSVGGFGGYKAGEPLPSVVQILNGEPPANSPKVVVVGPPGAKVNYSGGGITILQLAVMDITQRPPGDVVRDLVLGPAGMSNSTFEQPLPEERRTNFASGHTVRGKMMPGGGNVQPTLFAAGLWTTPADLCRFAIALQNALRGAGDTPFSKALATDITTRTSDGPSSPGFFIDDPYFLHGGSNDGFRCLLKANKTEGYGFAFMSNSDNGEPLEELLFKALADAYEWDQSPGKAG